jgi:uncharacterized protein (UPF0248 family)
MSQLPIHKLLSRIRWDREFGQGTFVLGYEDRFSNEIIRVPFSQVMESPSFEHALRVLNPDGEAISIPLHRIVEVHKDGQLIWQRGRS